MYDANILARFTKRPAAPRDTNWSLWQSLQFGQSLFKRVQGGSLQWAWGENPYTCPITNIHATKEDALQHYRAAQV